MRSLVLAQNLRHNVGNIMMVGLEDLAALANSLTPRGEQDPLRVAAQYGTQVSPGGYTSGDISELGDYFSSVRALSVEERTRLEESLLSRAAAFGRTAAR
jgi:hypothetical protein